METQTMGRVVVEAVIENLKDLWDAESGRLAVADVRRVALADALVDTGATTLSLPTRFIEQLGLKKRTEKRVSTSAGDAVASLYDAVRLTVRDRQCTVDVLEVPDNVPVLIGQVPLELLDFVIDLRNRTLTGNPAHGGEHVFEMY
jgi:predicted aspartyl protease